MFNPFPWSADRVAFRMLGLEPGTALAEAVRFFVEDTLKIFTLLAAIVFVMALFRTMLEPQRIRGYLDGKPRGIAYGLAAILGAVTPFCSCSSVPLFIGFLEAGIPVGVTMAFLIASPMINEVAVVILAAAVGWQLTALYVTTGLAVGIAGGILADRFGMDHHVEEYVWRLRTGRGKASAPDLTLKGRFRFASGEVAQIVRKVWLHVIAGIGIGSFLHGYVPQDWLARVAGGDNPLAVPLAVLAGIPLYSNATGIIPVAEALISKGIPIGTVLVLMMSVVAISVPEFVILRKVVTVRGLAWFAGYLTLAFIGIGYAFNMLLM